MKTLKLILSAIAIGVWTLVFQNLGLIPNIQKVRVVNEVDANVANTIKADVSGSVSIDNTVDVNIHQINGYNQVTTKMGTQTVFPFGYMLPVDSW